jgi:hypothetical protein
MPKADLIAAIAAEAPALVAVGATVLWMSYLEYRYALVLVLNITSTSIK